MSSSYANPNGFSRSILCPNCGHNRSAVLDSRPSGPTCTSRRRRSCEKCKENFTTFEMYESDHSRIERLERLYDGIGLLLESIDRNPIP